MNGNKYDGRAGYILAENLAGLIFYLVMLAAAGILLVTLFSGSELSSAEQGLSTIRLQTRQLYTGSGDYEGLDTDTAVTAGVIPGSMVKSDGSVKNPWNGEVTVAEGQEAGTFVITFAGVPKDAVVKLAGYQSGSWLDVAVNDVSLMEAGNLVSAASANAEESNIIAFTSN